MVLQEFKKSGMKKRVFSFQYHIVIKMDLLAKAG
jgi:hypothetical protein